MALLLATRSSDTVEHSAAARTARIASSRASSLHCGFGPRRREGPAGAVARSFTAYTVKRATSPRPAHAPQTIHLWPGAG
jgi:hypothetical protein